MAVMISSTQFTRDLLYLMAETFESVHGVYLDRGTSLLETLAELTAQQASIPVGGSCASIAAQVTHVCFYLDVLDQYIQTGQNQDVDWGEVWRTVRDVTPDEWSALQERVHQAYVRICETVKSYEHWDVEHSLSGAMGILAHTAYHLGEIRQATCTIK